MNPEERRKEILLASLRVFERDGFHKAKVSDIANTANIGKGTIYEYFSSKKSLFEEMAKFCINEYINESRRNVEKELDPINKLRRYIKTEKDIMSKYGNIANIVIQEMDTIGVEIKKLIMKARGAKIALIEEILEDGRNQGIFRNINPKTFALLFMGGTHQIIADKLMFCSNKEKQDTDISIDYDQVIDIIIDGIGN